MLHSIINVLTSSAYHHFTLLPKNAIHEVPQSQFRPITPPSPRWARVHTAHYRFSQNPLNYSYFLQFKYHNGVLITYSHDTSCFHYLCRSITLDSYDPTRTPAPTRTRHCLSPLSSTARWVDSSSPFTLSLRGEFVRRANRPLFGDRLLLHSPTLNFPCSWINGLLTIRSIYCGGM